MTKKDPGIINNKEQESVVQIDYVFMDKWLQRLGLLVDSLYSTCWPQFWTHVGELDGHLFFRLFVFAEKNFAKAPFTKDFTELVLIENSTVVEVFALYGGV